MAVGDGGGEAVEQLINTAFALGSTTIDLSKKRLTQVPPEVLNLQQLEVHFTFFSDKYWLTISNENIVLIRFTTYCPMIKINQVSYQYFFRVLACLLFYCLQFLYLEGNAISSLPEELFDCLPNLRWLDLRNNRITEIPPIIGKHRFDN